MPSVQLLMIKKCWQLHAKRIVNAKKPAKKSGFMSRLEKMQQEQQKAIKNRK